MMEDLTGSFFPKIGDNFNGRLPVKLQWKLTSRQYYPSCTFSVLIGKGFLLHGSC